MSDYKAGFFIVWSPEGTSPPKFRHPSFDDASAEAARLASVHMGRKFFVMEARRSVTVPPSVIVEDFVYDDGLPF